MYVSMKDAKAFGPYTFSNESLIDLLGHAEAFQGDIKAAMVNLAHPKGFYPLCGWCEVNADCPKFKMGDFQPQWEPAIRKLDALKKRENEIHSEITEIENALKLQAFTDKRLDRHRPAPFSPVNGSWQKESESGCPVNGNS